MGSGRKSKVPMQSRRVGDTYAFGTFDFRPDPIRAMMRTPHAAGPRSIYACSPPITMARPLRLEYPGALWHATNRGVEQRCIYTNDRESAHFLHLLQKAITEYRWQLLAYVLMSNHYHLLFRTPDTNLSLGMKDLDGDYASFFNA